MIERIKKTALSLNTLKWLCVAWLAVMLLPLFALCFYAHPAHDDFVHILDAAGAWAKTGSVSAALSAAWQHTVHMYQTWQGTYVAMFFSSFQPMVFSPNLFFLTPLLILVTFCLSAAYFGKALIKSLLGMSNALAVIVTIVLLTFMLEFLPSARETIYWQSGTPYTLSIIAIFLMLGLIFKLHARVSKPADIHLRPWRYLSLFLCAAALGACPYPLALGGLVGFGLIAAWCFWKRSPAKWAALLSLLSVAASLLVVVLAPGNAARQAVVGVQMSPAAAITQSLFEALQATGEWFSPQLLAICLLLVPLLWKPLCETRVSFEHPLWFLFFSFGVLAASFVPPIYATGVDGYLVERVHSSLYMLYALLVLLNAVVLTGWLARRHTTLKLFDGAMPAGWLALCIGLLIWGFFSTAIMTVPSIAATKSLLTGEAARYHIEMTAREKGIAAASSNAEALAQINTLNSEPVLLPRDMLPYPFQKKGGLPQLMHQYFRIQELSAEYGAGKIPQSEWEALESWGNN